MNIHDKSELRHLGQEAYTDGTLVYKFHERPKMHPCVEVEALQSVKHIPRTQQIVDYVESERVLITELVRGYHFNDRCDEFETGKLHYTQDQVNGLLETLVGMKEEGVICEINHNNIFYDRTNGFTPIDYQTSLEPTIHLGFLINVLSLSSIFTENCYANIQGNNRQNHPDVTNMIFEAYRHADPKYADENIDLFLKQQQRYQEELAKADPDFTKYFPMLA